MLKLLTKILLLVFLVAIVCFSLEAIVSWQLGKGKRYYFQADWHDLKGHNSTVVFVGNSRTWVQVDPFAIQKRYKTSVEIIAQDGQDIHFLWLKFKQYMSANVCPKEIYLQTDPYSLVERDDLYGFDNFRTVFFHRGVSLRSLAKRNGYRASYNNLPLYALNLHLMLKIIAGKTVPLEETFEKTHGFIALNMNWAGDWRHPIGATIDTKLFSPYLDSFFVFSKANGCKLYTFYPPQSAPSYRVVTYKDAIPALLNKLSEKYDCAYTWLNFNSEVLYNDSTLFYNHMHLNAKGVAVFSKQLLQADRAFTSFK